MSEPINAYLVCGGRWHDFDFARVELLKLLAEHESVRTGVAEDFRDLDALEASDFLLTYTCDLEGITPEQEDALASYVAGGRRWLALHGTNSVMEFLDDGRVATPRTHRTLMKTLGSQFIAHPPIAPYKVENVNPDHPLVAAARTAAAGTELEYRLTQRGVEVPPERLRCAATCANHGAPIDQHGVIRYVGRRVESVVVCGPRLAPTRSRKS